jgi:hypothetical protein
MYFLKYDNTNLFLERKNKIILTDYVLFYRFLQVLKRVECNKEIVELNGLKLNNKNTLIIDLSSISAIINIFNDDNKIIDEYLKIKLDNLIFESQDEEIINNIIKNYLEKSFGEYREYSIELDYLKILKSCSNLSIDNGEILLDMINSIERSNNIKQIIIIYKKSIINKFKLQEIENLEDDKIILFEICDKLSFLEQGDNILIFNREITQMRVDEFVDLIIKKSKIYNNDDRETYTYLINKILFYSINQKEVDIMKKYTKEISELVEILYKEFKINLTDALDCI